MKKWILTKKSRYFLLLFLFLFFTFKAQPSKEAWHWQFGRRCALDFSGGAPVPTNISMITGEGSASISDNSTGQLLFYTEGDTIWDKNNNYMQNGTGLIGGGGTTTQAALIIPKPNNSNIYYVITADQGGYIGPNQGVFYSEIDMTLNGGLGKVTTKNQIITPPPATEKLVGVKHCNDRDYWIITHPFNSNTFNSYLVSPSGINLAPIVSNAGTIEAGSATNTIGYLKASPNGKKLALVIYFLNTIELYDFDNSTGKVSNPIGIANSFCTSSNYGLSFSPDNTKLYIGNDGCDQLYQYDVSSGDSIIIKGSEIKIASNLETDALQIGPDGKIYVATVGKYIAVINNPNASGLSCNFQDSAIYFPSGFCYSGLPNFIDANKVVPQYQSINVSLCSFISDTLSVTGISNFLWSTADTMPNSSINNFGNYWVSYFNSQGCKEIDTFRVIQIQPPIISILHDTNICANKLPISINAAYPNVSYYNWNDGFSLPQHSISSPGTYWVDYTLNNFCQTRDSFNFFIDSLPTVNLGKDTSLCQPSLILSANSGDTSYVWNTGAIIQQIIVTSSGNYWVEVTGPQGCKNSDTINVTVFVPPVIDVLKDSIECGNSFLPVNESAVFPNTVSYNWSDSFAGSAHTISSPGTYWVDFAFNNTCVSRDSFNLYLYTYPIVSLGNDTAFCQAHKTMDATNAASTYLWSTGQTTAQIEVTAPGTYWVLANRHGCMASDTLTVFPLLNILNFSMPNIVTPNSDNINDEIDFNTYQFSSLQLDIYNRWGIKVFESNDPAVVWKPNCDDGSYYYVAQYKIDCGNETHNKYVKGFITVIK